MNKINPLYVLVFFVFMVLFMIFQTKSMESDNVRLAKEITTLEVEGSHIYTLKDRWKNPKESKNRIDKIFSQALLKKHLTTKESKKGIYYVTFNSLQQREADKLINDILNASISIKKLSFNRLSDQNISAKMELML